MDTLVIAVGQSHTWSQSLSESVSDRHDLLGMTSHPMYRNDAITMIRESS